MSEQEQTTPNVRSTNYHHNLEHYTMPISRARPSIFGIYYDVSGSTAQLASHNPKITIAEAIGYSVDAVLRGACERCGIDERTKKIKDYFKIALWKYGGAGVQPVFGKPYHPIDEIKDLGKMRECLVLNPDGTYRKQRTLSWIEPESAGGTPICQATDSMGDVFADFTTRCPNNSAGRGILITDDIQEGTDGDPTAAMSRVKSFATTDGNVQLWIAHIQRAESGAKPIMFPRSSKNLPNDYAKMLFENSSYLSKPTVEVLLRMGYDVDADSKAFVMNATMKDLIATLLVGSTGGLSIK